MKKTILSFWGTALSSLRTVLGAWFLRLITTENTEKFHRTSDSGLRTSDFGLPSSALPPSLKLRWTSRSLSSVFCLLISAFPKRSVVCVLLSVVFASACGAANLTNTWQFDNAGHYEVSDPTLIKVNTANGGRAELMLQGTAQNVSTLQDHLGSSMTDGLKAGQDVSLTLEKSGTVYLPQKTFISRVLQKEAGQWDLLDGRVANAFLNNSPGLYQSVAPGYQILVKMDPNWIESISGVTSILKRSGPAITTLAKVGDYAGIFGNGNGYIVSGASDTIQNASGLSFSLWCKLRTITQTAHAILVCFDETPGNYSFTMRMQNGNQPWVAGYLGSSSYFQLQSPTKLQADVWYFLTTTWDTQTGQINLYINGQADSQMVWSRTGVWNQHTALSIGGFRDSYMFNGMLDEVACWDRTLSSIEISRSYDQFRSIQFQVRSGNSNTIENEFVGPGGTTNSVYLGNNETLVSAGSFNRNHPFAQYKAIIQGQNDGLQTPVLQSVVLTTTAGGVNMDSAEGDFLKGSPSGELAVLPDDVINGYLALSRSVYGGYYTNGTYFSEVFDGGGSQAAWEHLLWKIPVEVSNSEPGLTGLFHLDGSWGDVAAGNGINSPTVSAGINLESSPRLGFQSAFFDDGISSGVASNFPGLGNVRTMSFWIKPQNINDGVLTLGGGSLKVVDGLLSASGFGDNQPTLYVNGRSGNPRLLPGWNHAALVWGENLAGATLVVGVADGDYFGGWLDEISIYSSEQNAALLQAQYVRALPISAGNSTFSVRVANSIDLLLAQPWSGSFSDPGTAAFALTGRYFQYRVLMAGDGSGTPVASNIRVLGYDGTQSVTNYTDSATRAQRGTFTAGSTAWYGDPVRLTDLAMARPVNLSPLVFLTEDHLGAIWHLDDQNWGLGQVLQDASGNGRAGNAFNGATASGDSIAGLASGSFDGVDDYAQFAQVPELANDNFMISFWMKSRSTVRCAPVSSYSASSQWFAFELNSDGNSNVTGQIAFIIKDSTNPQRMAVSTLKDLNNGQWRHVIGIREAGYIHLYVDGVRLASTVLDPVYGALTGQALFLGKHGTQSVFYNGLIDEVVILGSAPSERLVGRIYSGGYDTYKDGYYESKAVDAGDTAIWESISWSADGRYGLAPDAGNPRLLALWRLDGISGPVSNAVNALYAGTGFSVERGATGRFGNAFRFNGSGAYVSVPHSPLLEPSAFSLEAWVNPESLNTRMILNKRGAALGYSLALDATGRPEFWLSENICKDTRVLRRGQWSHLAAVYDGTRMRLYVNGALRDSLTPVGVNVSSGADLQIGRSYSGGNFFRGIIDEVAVYSAPLSEAQVWDNYRSGFGTLELQVRSGDTLPLDGEYYGPDGTPASFFRNGAKNSLIGVVPLSRYFQFRALIGSESHVFSPYLYGVQVAASRYPTEAQWIMPTVVRGYPFLGNLLGFDHTRTFNPNTDVKYQISGDSSAFAASNRWFYYNGSAGTWTEQDTNGLAIYNYQTSSKDDVAENVSKFYSQVYNATGGLFRFRAFLKSGGDQQIAVSNVTVIASRGRLVVTSPNGQERGALALIAAVPHRITWSWAGVVSDNLEVSYSINSNAGPWTVIATGVTKGVGGTNSLLWTTPQPLPDSSGLALYSNVMVRIRDLNDAAVIDLSDATFEITQRFKVTVPNGGERWYVGELNAIRWESADSMSTRASIHMAPNGDFGAGVPRAYDPSLVYEIEYTAINNNAAATNVFYWNTPRHVASLLSTNAKIRVEAPNGAYRDDSDAPFSMVGIVITNPEAGQKVKRGDPFAVAWRSISAGTNVHVDVSLDGGLTYQTNIYSFVENADGDNTVSWTVTQPESDTAVLRIRSLEDGRIVGLSEVFTIAGIDVIAPDGDEDWLAGSAQQIRWVAGGAGNTVSIFYTDLYDNTNTVWLPIAERTANTLSYDWTVSDRVSPSARVKVQSDEDPNLFAVSAQNFNIAGVKVTYPNLPVDTLVMGQQAVMTHAGAPMRWLRVKLEISYDRAATWNILGPAADEWTLRQPFGFRPTFPSRQTKVRATVIGATTKNGDPMTNIVDLSDDYFTVEGLLMEAPAIGSIHTLGTQSEIRWVSAGAGTAATIYYSSQGTNNFSLVAEGAFNNQTYPGRNPYAWQIPPTLLPSVNARVKVVSGNYQAITDPFILRGIRITSPTNGTLWALGTAHSVSWQYAGMNINSRGTISLSLDGGNNFTVLENDYDLISIPSYSWNINPDLNPTVNAIIRLKVLSSGTPADINFVADSDRFTLKGIKILTPATGGSVKLGDVTPISFITAAAGQSAKIEYSADGGATYDPVPVVQNMVITNGANTFNWNVETTRTPSSNAVIRITGTADSKVSGVFKLSGIRVDRPLQTDIWAVGEINTIQWVAQVVEPVFNLDLIYPDNTTLAVAQLVVGNSRAYTLPALALRGEGSISNVVLRVTDRQGTAIGLSAPFRLVSQPIIEVVSPKAGDYIRVGDEINVVWVKGGSMNATDFSAWFSRDGFATSPEDIGRTVTYNPNDNTFVMPWVVPDRLGEVQVMVTNSVNPSLTAFSGKFNIVGSFDLIYPNGDQGEEEIYANQTKAVSWFTEGTVEFVDLYYKSNGGSWVKANSAPIDNNPRQGRYQTFYQWTAPTLRSDAVRLRVQDAAYPDPNQFDGTKIGPYDDSDNTFALNYFSVTWVIGYMEKDEDTEIIAFRELDKLSVTDSSGWSLTGLDSPFSTNYPYGAFDTVWYRQFFNDRVDFRWMSDRDQTRTLIMQPSDTEPDANVMATFVYDPGQKTLRVHAWIERGGRVLNNPDTATIHFYDTDGKKLKQLSSDQVLADGFFRINWLNILDPFQTPPPNSVTRQLHEGETYLARVEVIYNKVLYSAAVTYTLSLAPEFAQVQNILDRVESMETNLTGQVAGIATNLSDLTDITTGFRDQAMGSLGTIESRTGEIATNVSMIAEQLSDFTNTVITPLAFLTNQMVDVYGPTLTNMAEQVQTLVDTAGGEQARILNRPTTVEYGSTNTILYKTTRGLDAGTVRLTVEGTGRQFNMSEVGTGLGIYGVDIVANWGLGSYMISCSDPAASDRMILEVVLAGASSMGDLADTVRSLESQMTNMTEVLRVLNDPTAGLSAMVREIGSGVAQMGAAIAAGGGVGTAGSASIEALLGGGAGGGEGVSDSSLLGRIANMGVRLEAIYGEASDAASAASGAKTQAGAAANAARELKELLSGEYSVEAAMGLLGTLQSSVDSVNSNIENIPKAIGAQSMQGQIESVAHQIEEMAKQAGYAYEIALTKSGAPGTEAGEAVDDEKTALLNKNMTEVKSSLDFVQKLLDDKINEPVVTESWTGVE